MADEPNLSGSAAHDLRRPARAMDGRALVRASLSAARAIAKRLPVHDWIALGYLTLTLLAVSATHPGQLRRRLIDRHLALLVLVLTAIAAVRAPRGDASYLRGVGYRAALCASIIVSYLLLGQALPALNHGSVDGALYRLDLRLFGFEPAIWLERYASSGLTDWFALFYLGYFGVIAFFMLPIVFFGNHPRLTGEVATAMLLIYAVGQTLYAIVPGFGPRTALAGAFTRELHGGALFSAMNAIVARAGAKKDIFPSLHTAAPVALALIAFRHRRLRSMRWAWPVVAFTAANIVVATMFLRWHYLIDVVAGLGFAVGGKAAATRIVDWELARRRSGELGSLWPSWPRRDAVAARASKSAIAAN